MIKKNRRPTGLKDEIVIQGTTTGRVSGRAPARANRPKAETARSPKVTPHFKGGHSSSALGITLHQTTATYTADAMREYGTEVVEQRAIPDFRDGLKPVQRMALWSLRKLGMHSTSGFKKSARVVGEIIGKFHPHGDGSAYQAMVGIAGTKYQDKSLGKGWAGRNCAVPLVEGVGNWGDFIDSAAAYRYCFEGNTRIMTSKGLIRIVDMPKAYGYDVDVKEEGLKVKFQETQVDSLKEALSASHWINSGIRETYEVTTAHGYKVICTSNEPLYAINEYLEHEWVEVEHLQKGMHVSLKRGTQCTTPDSELPLPEFLFEGNDRTRVYELPTHMSLDLAKVLGYIVGDGYINNSHVVGFNNVSDEVFNDFISCFSKAFPDVPFNTSICKPSSYGKVPYNQFNCNSTYLVDFFSSLGLFKGDSHDRVIPEIIFRSSKTEVGAFLSALFESDGTAGGKTISYMSMSDDLLNDMKLIMLNYFGIVTSKICSGHKIYVLNYRNLSKFMKHIGFVSSRKNRRMRKGLRNFSTQTSNSKTDVVPFVKEFGESFGADYKISPRYAVNEIGEEVFLNAQGGWIGTRSLKGDNRRFRHAFRAKYRDSDFLKVNYPETHATLSEIYERDYLYDEVVSVRKMKRHRFVYDLTVPGTHAFVANGFVAHNTECRLSKFSDMYLLDPDYLAVMDYVPNFDDSEKVPVVLPAKVPVVLLNGFSSIAVGVSGSSAPFGLPGVLKLTRKALEGAEVTIRDCVRTLTFDYPYGGVCISEPKDLVPVFKGKGSAAFMPTYELSDDQKTLTFINVCPGLMSSRSIETFLDKLSLVRGVATVDDDTNKRGARYVVTFARTLKGPELEAAIDHCLDISIRSDSYDIGITIRDPLGRASFRRASIPEIFKLWAEWRLDIEVKVIARLILLQEKHKARQELLLLAVDNLETIIKALRVKQATASVTINGEVSEVDASAAYLMKALKISLEDANSILDMKVRQLRAMERTRILAKIKEHLVEIKHLKVYHKAPHTRVIEDLDRMMTVEL